MACGRGKSPLKIDALLYVPVLLYYEEEEARPNWYCTQYSRKCSIIAREREREVEQRRRDTLWEEERSGPSSPLAKPQTDSARSCTVTKRALKKGSWLQVFLTALWHITLGGDSLNHVQVFCTTSHCALSFYHYICKYAIGKGTFLPFQLLAAFFFLIVQPRTGGQGFFLEVVVRTKTESLSLTWSCCLGRVKRKEKS